MRCQLTVNELNISMKALTESISTSLGDTKHQKHLRKPPPRGAAGSNVTRHSVAVVLWPSFWLYRLHGEAARI